ncbi:MAG: CHASE domain-containing protein, partial [Noviherbaspirillum sp.]
MPFRPSVAAASVLIVGLIATVVLFVGLRRLEHDKVELDFRQRANVRVLAVQQQLEETVQMLKVLNRLFATVEPVSRDQFHTFTQPLLQRYPYVQAFNFHRFLSGPERPAYEAEMRKRYPDFVMRQLQDGQLIPAQARDRHLVVDYIEPMRGNEAAFGLDVTRNAHLIETVQQAIDTGNAVATELLTLAQGGGRLRGL